MKQSIISYSVTRSCHIFFIFVILTTGFLFSSTSLSDIFQLIENKDVPELIKILEKGRHTRGLEKAAMAAEALGKMGDNRAVIPLIQALQVPRYIYFEEKCSFLRARAAEALGRLGDPRSIDPLRSALKIETNETAGKDIEWALEMNETNSIPTLSSERKMITNNPSIRIITALIGPSNPSFGVYAKEFLQYTVARIYPTIEDKNISIEELKANEDIYEQLDVTDAIIKITASCITKYYNVPSQTVMPEQVSFDTWRGFINFKSKDISLRIPFEGTAPLSASWTSHPETLSTLSKILLGPKALVVSEYNEKIAELVVFLFGPKPLLSILNNTKDDSMKHPALKALRLTKDQVSSESIIKFLNDDNYKVREDAAILLGIIRDKSSTSLLIEKLRDPNAFVRLRSARSLDLLKWVPSDEEQIIYYLIANMWWEDIRKFREKALIPLINILKVEKHDYTGILGEYPEDPRSRIAIILGDLGDARAVEPLIEALIYKSSQDYVAKALQKITNKNFGTNQRKWQEWWQKKQEISYKK